MNVRQLSGFMVDVGLNVVRRPLLVATHALPNGEAGPRNAVTLIIDRMDASVRETAGRILDDEALCFEAQQRRAAADERERATRLRVAAEEHREQADEELVDSLEAAEERRDQVKRQADEREEAVDSARASRTSSARKTASRQKQAVNSARDEKVEASAKRSERQRLEVLDDELDALDTEADAEVASDEAQRLRKAAGAAKAARKRTAG